MPALEFKGKQFIYSHHLSVPFRELKVEADKALPAQGQASSLNDNLIIHGDNLEALKALLPIVLYPHHAYSPLSPAAGK